MSEFIDSNGVSWPVPEVPHLGRVPSRLPQIPLSADPYEAAVERIKWVNANVTVGQVLGLLGERYAGRRINCPICGEERAKNSGDAIYCFECSKRYDVVEIFAGVREIEKRGRAARMIIEELGLNPVLRTDPSYPELLADLRASLCETLWEWAVETFPEFARDTTRSVHTLCPFGHMHPWVAGDGGGTLRTAPDGDSYHELPWMDDFMKISRTLFHDIRALEDDGDAWLAKARAALSRFADRRRNQ